MSNFIKMVYAKLNEAGIDTKGMDADTAVKKYNELEKGEKESSKNESEKNSEQEDTGTEAEKQKLKDKGIIKEDEKEQVNSKEKESSREERIASLKEELKKYGIFGGGHIRTEIHALENGFDTVEEYLLDEERRLEEKRAKAERQEQEKKKREEERRQAEIRRQEELEREIKEAPIEKRKQFEIIQKNNPMLDDYHVGIRSPKDIKTFAETLDDEESFIYGDFNREDAKLALKTGVITIYSSNPIRQGSFVSTSKNQAQDYAGGGKIYSKKIELDKIAWINGNEGQFADINQH